MTSVPYAWSGHDDEGNTVTGSGTVLVQGSASELPYVGAAYLANGNPAGMEASAGRPLGVHVTYWNLDQIDAAIAQAKADHTAGRSIPSLSFKLNSVGSPPVRLTWVQAAAGQADAKMADLAAKLAALPFRVDVIIHHEPQGDSDGTSAQFVAMQNRLLAMLPANAKPWICLIAWDTYASNNPAYALSKWYPTIGGVHLAFDFYNEFGAGGSWVELSKYSAQIAADAGARGVDWMIRETGLTDQAAADPRGPGWMDRQLAQMAAADPPGESWCYFNSSANSGTNSWPLTSLKTPWFNAVLQHSHPV